MPTPIGYKGYQGAAPRKTRRTLVFVAVVVVVMALILVYAVALVHPLGSNQPPARYLGTPGVSCAAPSLPANISQIEQSSAFTAVSGGSCYSYVSENTVTVSGRENETLGFDLYNGSVAYPCGIFPVPLVENRINVAVTPALAIESVQLDNDTASLNGPYSCGSSPPAVGVSSVQYIEVTIPAIPELNVSLNIPQGGRAASGLTAVIDLAGSNYTVAFAGVTQANPLLPGHTVSATQVIGTQPIGNATQLHTMWIAGTFLDGGTFSYEAQVVVTNTYANT